LTRIEGVAARGFHSAERGSCDQTVGELRSDFALQPVELAGTFGDLRAGFGLHRIEMRPETFKAILRVWVLSV